jgi:hypothetical protein
MAPERCALTIATGPDSSGSALAVFHQNANTMPAHSA